MSTPLEPKGTKATLQTRVRPTPSKERGRARVFILAAGLASALLLLTIGATLAAPPSETQPPQPTGACLSCHSAKGLELALDNGEKLSLYVDQKTMAASVHGDKLACTDCHSLVVAYPHQEKSFPSRRAYSLSRYLLCQRCHFANYTKTLDSMHFRVQAEGNTQAPVCTDCHTAHAVAPPHQPASISKTCARCHGQIYEIYKASVHGRALVEEGNQDVPTCVNCHRSHDIEDPRTASFRVSTPDLCAKCHSDGELMKKYGLSPDVVKTYLQDFHGVSVTFYRQQGGQARLAMAVCTDCHGVHDIQKIDDPDARVIKANLVQTCRQCHPNASDNFPAAWLSHYEVSLESTPLVFLARAFYWFLIPFMMVGLTLHIVLDIWRLVIRR